MGRTGVINLLESTHRDVCEKEGVAGEIFVCVGGKGVRGGKGSFSGGGWCMRLG